MPPSSRFDRRRRAIRASRRGISLRGVARDRGCPGVRGALSHVKVAIARREGGGTSRCRYLQRSLRLGPVVSCRRPTYIRARGAAKWRFDARVSLPPGTYTARSRAFDRRGNFEKKLRLGDPLKRNFMTLRVR